MVSRDHFFLFLYDCICTSYPPFAARVFLTTSPPILLFSADSVSALHGLILYFKPFDFLEFSFLFPLWILIPDLPSSSLAFALTFFVDSSLDCEPQSAPLPQFRRFPLRKWELLAVQLALSV